MKLKEKNSWHLNILTLLYVESIIAVAGEEAGGEEQLITGMLNKCIERSKWEDLLKTSQLWPVCQFQCLLLPCCCSSSFLRIELTAGLWGVGKVKEEEEEGEKYNINTQLAPSHSLGQNSDSDAAAAGKCSSCSSHALCGKSTFFLLSFPSLDLPVLTWICSQTFQFSLPSLSLSWFLPNRVLPLNWQMERFSWLAVAARKRASYSVSLQYY